MDITDNESYRKEMDSVIDSIKAYVKEQMIARKRIILAYDEELFSLQNQVEEIKKSMERNKKPDLSLLRMEMSLIKRIVRIAKKKFDVEMQPTLDPRLNKIIINGWKEKGGRLGNDEMVNFVIEHFLNP